MTKDSSAGTHSGLVVQEHRSAESFRQLEREWRVLEAHAVPRLAPGIGPSRGGLS